MKHFWFIVKKLRAILFTDLIQITNYKVPVEKCDKMQVYYYKACTKNNFSDIQFTAYFVFLHHLNSERLFFYISRK